MCIRDRFQTISSRKYITVEVVSVPSTKAGHISRVIRYLAQPTHDVVLLSNSSMNEGWLRRNYYLSLIHISEPTRLLSISYAVFCLKKKKKTTTKRLHVTM
eukprot:TRINITY_DN64884_c0_g1_i1.p1 TRINITY_DN64884_c0_g1~~TRINITY_DN64884_c0_g1_i1.p1  ORF type:complete len:101 (+),score=16.35 TRINITY_DN64884_c0_g1_i1:113-415(+)